MPTCPHCGHKFFTGSLEQFIKENQPGHRLSLKRIASSHFGVKRFADIPEEKHPEALEYLEQMIAGWKVNDFLPQVGETYVKGHLNGSATTELVNRVSWRLRNNLGDVYWVELGPDRAAEVVEKEIGDCNIWEYAYGPGVKASPSSTEEVYEGKEHCC